MLVGRIEFPEYTGLRCLMMPYIQGEPDSVPKKYHAYADIIARLVFSRGDVGYLTIDESPVAAGSPHRGSRARYNRAIHTEAGRIPGMDIYQWGGIVWGGSPNVTLEPEVEVLLANNLDGSCAVWDAVHHDTSPDGDIGHVADMYPYECATMMRAGEVHKIGILTPHESVPVKHPFNRQFLRIISSGVHGREPYFTENPLMAS